MNSNPRSVSEKHKDLVRRIFEDVWINADIGVVSELIASAVVFNYRGVAYNQAPGDLVELIERWRLAFPDLSFEVKELVAEGDMVAARVVYRGTQQKEWRGIPAEGRKIEVDEMMMFRFNEDRIVEVWEVADEFAERQQLLGRGG